MSTGSGHQLLGGLYASISRSCVVCDVDLAAVSEDQRIVMGSLKLHGNRRESSDSSLIPSTVQGAVKGDGKGRSEIPQFIHCYNKETIPE